MKNLPACLLLAGGKSERFWPLSDKNLIPIMGKPLVEWQIENLAKAGFKDIIIVGNKAIDKWFFSSQPNHQLNNNKYTINIRYVLQNVVLPGMAGAILSVYELYQKKYKGKPLYILNANDFYENSFHRQMLDAVRKQKKDAFIAAYRVKKHIPMGYLTVKGGRITNIVEKPEKGKEPSDLVNFVAHWYRKPEELFQTLMDLTGGNIYTKSRRQVKHRVLKISNTRCWRIGGDDLYEQAMAQLMRTRRFVPVVYQGEWQPLKYPWHLLDVMKFFLAKLTPGVKNSKTPGVIISPGATIVGPVILSMGVKILDNAKIVGPAYIGSNTIIGDQALVRESVVGANCIIGFGSEVARSYLGDHCLLHHNYIGDSILERDVHCGYGAVTANWRFDEHNIFSVIKGRKTDTNKIKLGTIIGQGTKIGVNASIMPGVKIGKNMIIMPGTVVSKDIAD